MLLGGLLATGCNHGVQWELRTFEDAQEIGRKTGRLTFVYFRSWYLVECTNFEENVLKSPEVLLQTRGMVCVPLNFDWDQPRAQQWGLKRVPAFAIVAPDGEVLERQQAPITHDDLLEAMREAEAKLARGAQSAETVPATPP